MPARLFHERETTQRGRVICQDSSLLGMLERMVRLLQSGLFRVRTLVGKDAALRRALSERSPVQRIGSAVTPFCTVDVK